VYVASWMPGEAGVLTASKDGRARIFPASGGEPKETLRFPDPLKIAVSSRDGQHIVTSTGGKTVELWSVPAPNPNAKPISLSPKYADTCSFVAISPDSERILVIHNEGASLFSLAGEEIPLVHEGGHVLAGAFSPDNRFVATGTDDGFTRVFQASDGKLVMTLQKADAPIGWVAFNENGSRLLTMGKDGLARSRPVKLDDIRKLLWSASTYCPSVRLRMRQLAEKESDARGELAACVARVDDAQKAP